MTKNMPLAKFIYPSDPLKKISGSAHEYCLFIRPFKIFPCCSKGYIKERTDNIQSYQIEG